MRKTASILLLLFFFAYVSAQEKKPQNYREIDYKTLHFGFTIGVNTMDMGIKRNLQDSLWADLTRIDPGFQVTIVSDLLLTENLNLRFLPGIAFGQRNFAFYKKENSVINLDRKIEVSSSYLEFPLLIKYSSNRLNNYRPYLIGGANYRFDMAARKDYSLEDDILIRLKPGDIYLEAGFGIDFYLRYFRLSPEIKLGVGLLNLRAEEPFYYDQHYDYLRSYVVMFNFHFE